MATSAPAVSSSLHSWPRAAYVSFADRYDPQLVKP
jgi:hypothetical protein